MTRPLGWIGLVRLGLVQAALGAVVVLVTSTLNRVMVVELALPAVVPGSLVALHYAVQLLRPRWGHGSDGTGRRTPWILGGMAMLAIGGIGAAAATAIMSQHPAVGLAGAVVAFGLVGLGVGAAGTSLLVFAAAAAAPSHRGVAAPIMWIMMIAGLAVTAGVAGHFLDPFSFGRLVRIVATVCGGAFALSCAALWRLEVRPGQPPGNPVPAPRGAPQPGFRTALRQIWAEPAVRRFTVFVFVSMLAYSAQDLVLEPFAGAVLHLAPGATTQLSGLQHAGALVGMVAVALLGGTLGRRQPALMGLLAVGGCVLTAAVLCGLAGAELLHLPLPPIRQAVMLLGFGNGAFAVSAIGAMMALAAQGAAGRQGVRMGLWGAAQAAAFGLGSLTGPALVEILRLAVAPADAYAGVFLVEGFLFLGAAWLARGVVSQARPTSPHVSPAVVGAV